MTEPSYFAALLGDSDTVPLYGFHRASQRVERVSRADFKEAQLVDDGSSLKRYWEGTPIYTQLEIPRCDVHRRIQELVNADD